ncbi:MAG: septum formation initiator family protein [Bacilli bacterium]|nr:septum formation initiator family protein [Bacilli bacterium]
MAKKMSKKAKRRLIILGPIAFFVICYSVVTLVTTTINLYNLHKEEKELNEKLTNLKANAKSLKTEINKLQDKEYIARYARENYLYTKNGEYVIKLDDDGKKIKAIKANYNEDYLIYGCFIVIILIFLFIIRRHFKSKKKKKRK